MKKEFQECPTLKGGTWDEDWELTIGFNDVEVTDDHESSFSRVVGTSHKEFKSKEEEN